MDLPCPKQGTGREEGPDRSMGSGAPLALGHGAEEPVG